MRHPPVRHHDSSELGQASTGSFPLGTAPTLDDSSEPFEKDAFVPPAIGQTPYGAGVFDDEQGIAWTLYHYSVCTPRFSPFEIFTEPYVKGSALNERCFHPT